MTAEANIESMQRAFDAFNRHDLEAVRETVADDFVEHEAPPELGTGFDAVVRHIEMLFTAFPDVHWEMLDLVAGDRSGAARLRMTGTHEGEFMGIPPSGRRIDLEVVDFLHFDDDGKATAHWGIMDRLELLEQLGAAPEMRTTSTA